uniref:Cationic amino acid transporter C-terminal domain-containing protein n=1 Tax=Ciona savignyi TaxID=51511 RepID=H2ZMS0_CIOSA
LLFKMCSNIGRTLSRLKTVDEETMGESKLARVLTVFDLTALGVGATLGAGVYILTGSVAKDTTGPSVVISFLIAALTSILSGLCYAEFGARVPKAGSGYVYSYVTVGECCAFVIGWNLILSYVIGAASVARAWTGNFDALIGNKIKTHMLSCCSMDVPGLAEYPDIFSFAIVMLLTVGSNVTQGMVTQTTIDMTPYGTGGFMPFGFGGLISGTATCFYAFVGFDCIATTGEEAINPQKSIPLGIVLSLAVCCIAYLAISATLTLMRPYFLLDTLAPLPVAFEEVGMSWASYPVAVGAICALSTRRTYIHVYVIIKIIHNGDRTYLFLEILLGAMFPMPRIIYAMAIDGLLFEFLANVHKKTKTPLVATFLSGTLAGIMAVFFDLKELVDLMSIGTLAAYTLVATSVLLLSKPITQSTESFEIRMLIQPKSSLPTQTVSSIVNWCTVASGMYLRSTLSMTLFSVTAVLASSSGWNGASIAFSVIFMICSILPMICIGMQPQSNKKLSFAVPLVPTVPALNMFVNIYLMVSLPPSTWYKMLIWLVMGGMIYVFYGIRNSAEN